MIGEMYDATRFEVVYMLVNCDRCDAPLLDDESRVAGLCADCDELLNGKVIELVEDPYGSADTLRGDGMKDKVLAYFRDYYAEHHRTPSLRVCGDALGINHMKVAYYVEKLEREGNLVRNNRKIYLARNFKMIDNRKGHNAAANEKKSYAGMAGAEALKRRSLETGISRFNPGLAKDAKTIEMNIARIVKRAEENGTLYHPRPKLVVLIGEKVG